MLVLRELEREYFSLLRELGIENREELRKKEYTSISLSRAKRKRSGKVYRWLILTGKREGKTRLIKNFYADYEENHEKLRKLCSLYRAIKSLEGGM